MGETMSEGEEVGHWRQEPNYQKQKSINKYSGCSRGESIWWPVLQEDGMYYGESRRIKLYRSYKCLDSV